MGRLHLFELEDQTWLPSAIRDGVTDFLEFAVVKGEIYKNIEPQLMQAIADSNEKQVVDLCSGGGGAWASLAAKLPASVEKVLLTDLYPNTSALEQRSKDSGGKILYSKEAVNAMQVPHSMQGFRTLFSSFHHFRPEAATKILQDAVKQNAPIAILESTQRHPLLILYMFFTPILAMLSTPMIRPLRASRFIFTYLLPLIPLVILFDGIVSCLRTYTPKELIALTDKLEANDYQWQAGVAKMGKLPVGVTYLIGLPKKRGD